MTTPTTSRHHAARRTARPVGHPRRWGAWSIGLALAAAVGLAFTWAVSTAIDPPEWARIPVILLLPVGVLGSLLTAAGAWQGGARGRAATGLTLTAAVVIGFVVLLNTAG